MKRTPPQLALHHPKFPEIRMNRYFTPASPVIGSIVFASFCLLCAASASGGETGMEQLQDLQSKRARAVQTSTSIVKSVQDGSKALAGNMGSGGAGKPPGTPAGAAAPRSTDAQQSTPWSVAGRSGHALDIQPQPPAGALGARRAAAQRGDRASLNPQPLPPVERNRGAKRDGGALPNGIIIVGGKQAAGR